MSSKKTDKRTKHGNTPDVDPHVLILAKALKKARINAGLTQTELAGRMGTSQTEIHRIENGIVNFRVSKLMDFAKALEGASIEIHITPDYKNKDGFQTETHFVILSEADGATQRSSARAFVKDPLKEGAVDERIIWLSDDDDGES